MIGHRAGECGRRFSDIEAIHGLVRPTRGGKLACVSQTPRPTRQKISAQRENYFGFVEVIARVSCVCAERFVLMPFRTWVFRKETRDLIEKSGGRFTPRQQAQAGATACLPSR